jgi:hypothetical protein
VWQRPNLGAKDDDPRRGERLARLRVTFEQLKCPKAMVFADELDIHLSPKVGYAWMPKGTQMTGMIPGTNEKHYLAGFLDLATGALLHCIAAGKTNALFRDLLTRPDACDPAERYTRLCGVVDNYTIHHAKAVEQWLASQLRVARL